MAEKRGPKVYWTEKRVKALAKYIQAYALEAFDRQGEMKGLNFVGPILPSLAECFKKNRISSSTAYRLEKEYPELASAIKKVKDAQEFLLVNYALRQGYASTFAIFAAKNLLGWKDERAAVNLNVDNSKHNHYTRHTTVLTDGADGTDGTAGKNGRAHAEAEPRVPGLKLS